MKIVLCDVNPDITEAWKTEFANFCHSLVEIEIKNQKFQTLKDDNIVMTAAGNSYGIMGGGIDLQIARYFKGVEESVQVIIDNLYYGELLVGNSVYIPINENGWVGLIYSPTMRSPSVIRGTDNVYKATYATLIMYNNIYTAIRGSIFSNLGPLIMPGFGGQCGQVPSKSIARQMRLAIENFFNRSRSSLNHQRMNAIDVQILEATRLR